ncbi:hypothetical protein EHQ23_02395 [Leptospira bourretii]|uniref:DUF6602 domain-containing protein n=1 Tax=Leptospira bourretii TaxID=2484962 RepID=A0A4R9INM1_9LEPT|nr:DUF6602 domain-containing protein [Leptospira bourretii]TGK89986.1 hypothetical protein EHQ23_02395 [Leptospira bourretii]TGK92209.1 hypothetical protein EHQ26_09540 [Leptospira bourretii]TGL27488.1 hypothetical protein EHQ45_17490 [Leptospira bourretii]
MNNKIYEEYLKLDIEILLAESEIAKYVEHSGMTGTIREFGIGKFLEKYLPENWNFGKGKIIDSSGTISPEIDLIIYNKTNLSPRMYRDKEGIFPIECVLYAFEIKSTSSKANLLKSVENFHQLKTLKSTSKRFGNIRCVYFAYSTDITEKTEIDRYFELDEKHYWNPAFNVLCILDRGYWVYYNETLDKEKKQWKSSWHKFDVTNNKYYIKGLLMGILNTIASENSKLSAAPSLSSYFEDEEKVPEIIFEKEYKFG